MISLSARTLPFSFLGHIVRHDAPAHSPLYWRWSYLLIPTHFHLTHLDTPLHRRLQLHSVRGNKLCVLINFVVPNHTVHVIQPSRLLLCLTTWLGLHIEKESNSDVYTPNPPRNYFYLAYHVPFHEFFSFSWSLTFCLTAKRKAFIRFPGHQMSEIISGMPWAGGG